MIDVPPVMFCSNHAACMLRQENYNTAILDATMALGCTEDICNRLCIKTLFRRAKAFYHTHRPFEALGELQTSNLVSSVKQIKSYDVSMTSVFTL